MAPGGDAYQSTTGTGYVDAVYSTLGSFDGSGHRTPSFGPLMGTSMATPHVSGVIALMRYVFPGITPAAIDTLIANGQITDDLGAPGRDDTTGYGLIDARKAVDEAIKLASSGATSPEGVVVASPTSISFGSVTASATLELKLTAPGTETVTSITSNSAAVTVTPGAIDPTTKLGSYVVAVNRSLLPSGTSVPTLTVTTSTRTFTVQLAIVKAATALSATASYGRMIVYVADAASGARLAQINVQVSGGRYVWSIPGIPAGQVRIVAGTNLDYDGFFCDLGEVCGIYPETADSITVNQDLSGLDFAVSPTGVTSSSSLQRSGVGLSPLWPPSTGLADTTR
jgi:serine protease